MDAGHTIREPEEYRWRRAEMVDQQIVARGVADPRVLEAMRETPRHLFVPPELVAEAYEDRALPVGPGQTISQPYIVAYMTAELATGPAQHVLEIGTGTGYQAAILARLVEAVYTMELDAGLSAAAKGRLERLGMGNVRLAVGDGSLGWPAAGPFDRIIVTAGCPRVPPALVEQLAVGGVMVLPVGELGDQVLVRIRKRESGTVETPLIGGRFVKLVGAQGWPSAGFMDEVM